MRFRIKHSNTNADLTYEELHKDYFSYLDQFSKTSNTDLWKYFYWDFFHDGKVKSFKIKPNSKTIKFKISCHNIKAFSQNNTHKYIMASFSCEFKNVVYFKLTDSFIETVSNPCRTPITFLYSEINTSPRLKKLGTEFYSLLIEFLSEKTIWLEIIFSQVNVLPKEPLTFALMEMDKSFEIPVFYPHSQKEKTRC